MGCFAYYCRDTKPQFEELSCREYSRFWRTVPCVWENFSVHIERTSMVYNHFRDYLLLANIPHTGRGPRIHDFRHGFAVENLRFSSQSRKSITRFSSIRLNVIRSALIIFASSQNWRNCLNVDIKVKHIRLDKPAVVTLHGKGNKTRQVPIMPSTVNLLRSYLASNFSVHIERTSAELQVVGFSLSCSLYGFFQASQGNL